MHARTGALERKPQWLIGGVAFVAGIVLTAIMLGLTAPDEPSSHALGRALVPLVLVSAAMMLVLRRSPLWFRLGWVTLFVMLVLSTTGVALLVRDHILRTRALNDAVRTMMTQMQQVVRDPDVVPVIALERPENDEDYALAIYLTRWIVQSRRDNRKQYLDALQAAGWDRLLMAEELARPGAQATARTRIAAVRRIQEVWIGKERATTRRFLSEMERAELPADFRRGFMRSMAESDVDARADRALASERAIVDAAEDMIEVLFTHRWTREGDAFMFHTQEGLDAYEVADAALQETIRSGERQTEQVLQKIDEYRKKTM